MVLVRRTLLRKQCSILGQELRRGTHERIRVQGRGRRLDPAAVGRVIRVIVRSTQLFLLAMDGGVVQVIQCILHASFSTASCLREGPDCGCQADRVRRDCKWASGRF